MQDQIHSTTMRRRESGRPRTSIDDIPMTFSGVIRSCWIPPVRTSSGDAVIEQKGRMSRKIGGTRASCETPNELDALVDDVDDATSTLGSGLEQDLIGPGPGRVPLRTTT